MNCLSWRLAFRQISNDRLRFAILVGAIVIPVLALTAWFVLRASSQPTPEVATRQEIGQAEAVLSNDALLQGRSPSEAYAQGHGELIQRGLAETAVPIVSGSAVIQSSGSTLVASIEGRDADPVFTGRRLLDEGRWATEESEVVLSPAVLTALNGEVGATVEISDQTFTVVGVAIDPNSLDARLALPMFRAGLGVVRSAEDSGLSGDAPTLRWFLTAPLMGESNELAASGWQVMGREEVEQAHRGEQRFDNTNIYLAGLSVVALGELLLIFAAIYSIVLRARERQFALLGIVGASHRLRRRVMVLDGTMVGLTSAVLGLGLGIVVARLLSPRAAALTNQYWEELRLPWLWLSILALLVIGSAAGASRLAVTLVRSDLVAVAGDVPRPPVGWTRVRRCTSIWVLGAVAVALAGLIVRSPALTLLAIAGLLVGTIRVLREGYAVGTSARGRLQRVLARRAVSVRPSRSALFAAVPLSIVVVLGCVSGVMGAATARSEALYVPEGPVGSATIETTKPLPRAALDASSEALGASGAAVFAEVAPSPPPLDEAGYEYTYWGRFTAQLDGYEVPVHTGGPGDVEVLLGRPLSKGEVARFNSGAALSMSGELGNGSLRVTAPAGPDDSAPQAHHLPVVVVGDEPVERGRLPVLVVSPETARNIGMPQPNFSIGYLAPSSGEVPDDRAEAAAYGAVAAAVGQDFAAFTVERGSQAAESMWRLLVWGLSAVLVASLALSVLMVNLMIHESRRDLYLLSAVGVDGRARATIMAWQSIFTSGLGAVLGVVLLVLCLPPFLVAASLRLTMWPVVVAALAIVATAGTSVLVTVIGARWWSRPRTGPLAAPG